MSRETIFFSSRGEFRRPMRRISSVHGTRFFFLLPYLIFGFSHPKRLPDIAPDSSISIFKFHNTPLNIHASPTLHKADIVNLAACPSFSLRPRIRFPLFHFSPQYLSARPCANLHFPQRVASLFFSRRFPHTFPVFQNRHCF